MQELAVTEPSAPGSPEWIEPTFRFTPGMDPFGIRALTAARIVAPLIPGILALSTRARYLSLFAWLLGRYADQRRQPSLASLSSYMLRREYEFALAVRLHGCGASPVGMDRAGPAVDHGSDTYDRGESVKSSLGGYGLYYRSAMRALELVRLPGTILGDEAIRVDVLNRGLPRAVAVADAFGSAVADTEYVREYIDADGPIPADVLIEYGSKACLCQLPEFPMERDLLREAVFEPSPGQDVADVASRRGAMALFLHLLATNPVDKSDAEFRWAIWDSFEAPGRSNSAYARVLTRWSALTALNFIQDGINLLWVDGGKKLHEAASSDGLDWAAVEAVLAGLTPDAVDVLGAHIECGASRPAAGFYGEVARATRGHTMREVDLWAVSAERSAIAGVILILATLARIPRGDEVSDDWRRIAGVEGEWQPGLRSLATHVLARIDDGDSVGGLVTWLVEHLVIRAHESNAYSKLPDFTFRWRSEAGRLRFYDHPIDWVSLADLRSFPMGSLLTDLGYCEKIEGNLSITADGQALVDEVFG